VQRWVAARITGRARRAAAFERYAVRIVTDTESHPPYR